VDKNSGLAFFLQPQPLQHHENQDTSTHPPRPIGRVYRNRHRHRPHPSRRRTYAVNSNPTTAQPTKPNPFAGIINSEMHITAPITFEDWYPMFEVNFKNLKNYEMVQTEGCTILEIYNVTRGHVLNFCKSWEVYSIYNPDIDPDLYMPINFGGMSNIFVYTSTWNAATNSYVGNVSNGDILRIKFKVQNDAQYESPEFVLYAPYIYDPESAPGTYNQQITWE